MGYKIQYSQTGESVRVAPKKYNQLRYIIIVCILIACCLALYVVDVKEVAILDYFLPGNPEVTKAAFFSFAEDLRSGLTFSDAVTAFCREIIENASY